MNFSDKSTLPKLLSYSNAFLIVVGIMGIGTFFLIKSHAATPAASLEPESGVKSSQVSIISDATASNSQAVQFGNTAWPSASTTGVPSGVVLTNNPGMVVSTANSVIDSMSFTGQVYITANNVTIKRSKVKFATQSYLIRVASGVTGTLIEDVEIDGGVGSYTGIYGDGVTIKRANIHNVENGVITAASTSIADSFIHDLVNSGSPHYDGIEINGGTNISVVHNTIAIPNETGTVNVNNYFGPVSNILIDNNQLTGGTYTIYVDGQFAGGPITGVTITNNRISGGQFGYALVRNCTITQSGNVDNISGTAISL